MRTADTDEWIARVLGLRAPGKASSTRPVEPEAVTRDLSALDQAVGLAEAAALAAERAGDEIGAAFQRSFAVNLARRREALASDARAAQRGDGMALWMSARSEWLEAVHGIGQDLTELGSVLRASEDADYAKVADGPLPEFAQQFSQAFDRIGALVPSGGEVLSSDITGAQRAIGTLRIELATSEAVHACEDNPVGVRVSISPRLDPILGKAEAALSRLAAENRS